MADARQNPEKLLQRIQDEERRQKRGKLKIYLGAAPGVGKTYTMLQDALAQHDKGLDVVIGIAESHGRKEIDALIKDIVTIPKQVIDYRGKQLLEFDLDAALKRSPELILVDEMAHTNVPGLRHAKRWQDIKELLDRGINVYTTLNVQHIESLNDQVSQIIHAPVRETVPDSMIEIADTIELVDLPPDDLLKRLQEGKIYIPEQARLAVEHFFRKGNLTALRELALRTTAERVGTDVLLYRQGQGIKHIWPTKEKILVCVGGRLESLKLIRAARRMATSLQAEWIAIHVDVPRIRSSEAKRDRAIQNLRFAEQLGAETRVLIGPDIIKEILNFAHEQNVTQIMVWKHIRTRWQEFFLRSLADEIVRNSGEIDVYIMTGERSALKPTPPYTSSLNTEERKSKKWRNYIISICTVVIATVINTLLYPFLHSSELIMVYLLSVTLVATLGQIGPSILASVLSVLAFAYFFTPPFYTFAITNIEYIFTLLVMLLVAQIISHLTILNRRQIELARFAETQTAALHSLSRQLANTRGVDKLLEIGIHYLSSVFDSDVLMLIPKNNCLVIRTKDKTNEMLDVKEQSIAEWVYALGQVAGLGTDTLSFSDALYVPLLASQGAIGVARIHPHSKRLFTPEQMHLIESCTNQIGLAIEVDRLQEQAKKKELKVETDRARSTLLQSVSHDLRTPLIGIIAAASTLMENGDQIEAKSVKKLGKDIYLESEQLSRLINNLLQITYLEDKNVKPQKQFSSIKDTINLVIRTSTKKLGKRPVHINIPDHLPDIPFDTLLIQEVLINLIDNAIKFTPPLTAINIIVEIQNEKMIISIEDYGPGIAMDEMKKLFEKFYRGQKITTERGLGLGLAICRHIIEAHDGQIWAENKEEGGAAFRFTLPLK